MTTSPRPEDPQRTSNSRSVPSRLLIPDVGSVSGPRRARYRDPRLTPFSWHAACIWMHVSSKTHDLKTPYRKVRAPGGWSPLVFYSGHPRCFPQKRSKKSLAQPKTLPPKIVKPRFGYPPTALWARPCTCPLPLKMDGCILNYIDHLSLSLQAHTHGARASTESAQVSGITRPKTAVRN